MPPSWACRAHILGTFRPYGWISSFFTAVFCSTQLASSIAVPVVPLDPQEELIVTRDHS